MSCTLAPDIYTKRNECTPAHTLNRATQVCGMFRQSTTTNNDNPTWSVSLPKLPLFLAALEQKTTSSSFSKIKGALSLVTRGYITDAEGRKVVMNWVWQAHLTAIDWGVKHSTSGYAFKYNSAAINWGSKKQPSVALKLPALWYELCHETGPRAAQVAGNGFKLVGTFLLPL